MVDGIPSVRRRRYRRLKRRSGAVVSVIGTLLALLVFFALFGIFLTEYLPLWMTDNESEWTTNVQASFAQLQSNMNLQVELGTTGLLSTPFDLSSDGVPLFAQPSQGILSFIPQSSGVYVNISSTLGPGGGGAFYQNLSLGVMRLAEENRYFPPQTFELENNAVVQAQSDTHQIVVFPPPLALNVSGTTVGANLEIFQMTGNATQAVSTGSEEVYSNYLGDQTYNITSNGATFTAKVVVGSHYSCAWQAFLASLTRTNGLPSGDATIAPSGCVSSQSVAQDTVLSLRGLSYLRVTVANFEMIIGVGVN